MTFGDLLDQVARSADDSSGAYRNAAITWLNLTRAMIADSGFWRSALRANASLTLATRTDGIFSLTGYEFISGDFIYDETDDVTIRHESLAKLNEVDVSQDVTGTPSYWADAGMSNAGVRQFYLWPRPTASTTIRFAGYLRLTDITADDEADTVDPFFGPLSPWAPTFLAGMRYYHDLDSNEDVTQISMQYASFERLLKKRRAMEGTNPLGGYRLENVRGNPTNVIIGRLDPAHFSNQT